MRFQRIGVLMGGLSRERDISLQSGRAVAAGLRRSGYDVVEIDTDRDLDRKLREARPEAVYIALHGRLGEDGTVQGLLEVVGIPYTGSSVTASALAMDKIFARTLLQAAGVPVAPGLTLTARSAPGLPAGFGLPVVVKPADEGSSFGVTIVKTPGELEQALAAALACSDRVLVERFVAGVEATVAVLDGAALGTLEVEPHAEFYDFTAKYAAGGSTHHVPARLPPDALSAICDLGERSYACLGCSGAARVDVIVPPSGSAVVLEVNTIPGMTQRSLLPEIAAAAGLTFDTLVARIMEGAALHADRGIAPKD